MKTKMNKSGKVGLSFMDFVVFLIIAVVLGFVVISLFSSQIGVSAKIGSSFLMLAAGVVFVILIMLAVGGFKLDKNASFLALAGMGVMVFFILKGQTLFPGIFSAGAFGTLSAAVNIPTWLLAVLVVGLVYFAYVKVVKNR